MGLDISYVSKINFERRREPDFEEMDQNGVFLYPNDSLLDQSEGIKGGEYTVKEYMVLLERALTLDILAGEEL